MACQPIGAQTGNQNVRLVTLPRLGQPYCNGHEASRPVRLLHQWPDRDISGSQQIGDPWRTIGQRVVGAAGQASVTGVEQRQEPVLGQVAAQAHQLPGTLVPTRTKGWKLHGDRGDLAHTVNDAGHVRVCKFRLSKHQRAKLFMPLGVQVDLGVNLRHGMARRRRCVI